MFLNLAGLLYYAINARNIWESLISIVKTQHWKLAIIKGSAGYGYRQRETYLLLQFSLQNEANKMCHHFGYLLLDFFKRYDQF